MEYGYIEIPEGYFSEYPTYIEVPKDYWACLANVEYVCKEN